MSTYNAFGVRKMTENQDEEDIVVNEDVTNTTPRQQILDTNPETFAHCLCNGNIEDAKKILAKRPQIVSDPKVIAALWPRHPKDDIVDYEPITKALTTVKELIKTNPNMSEGLQRMINDRLASTDNLVETIAKDFATQKIDAQTTEQLLDLVGTYVSETDKKKTQQTITAIIAMREKGKGTDKHRYGELAVVKENPQIINKLKTMANVTEPMIITNNDLAGVLQHTDKAAKIEQIEILCQEMVKANAVFAQDASSAMRHAIGLIKESNPELYDKAQQEHEKITSLYASVSKPGKLHHLNFPKKRLTTTNDSQTMDDNVDANTDTNVDKPASAITVSEAGGKEQEKTPEADDNDEKEASLEKPKHAPEEQFKSKIKLEGNDILKVWWDEVILPFMETVVNKSVELQIKALQKTFRLLEDGCQILKDYKPASRTTKTNAGEASNRVYEGSKNLHNQLKTIAPTSGATVDTINEIINSDRWEKLGITDPQTIRAFSEYMATYSLSVKAVKDSFVETYPDLKTADFWIQHGIGPGETEKRNWKETAEQYFEEALVVSAHQIMQERPGTKPDEAYCAALLEIMKYTKDAHNQNIKADADKKKTKERSPKKAQPIANTALEYLDEIMENGKKEKLHSLEQDADTLAVRLDLNEKRRENFAKFLRERPNLRKCVEKMQKGQTRSGNRLLNYIPVVKDLNPVKNMDFRPAEDNARR